MRYKKRVNPALPDTTPCIIDVDEGNRRKGGVKFYTLGCKVNQYETQGLRELLLEAAFKEEKGKKADIYIVNTCTVTDEADRDSRRLIRGAFRLNPESRIIVTGCYANEVPLDILGMSDKIHILPNQQKHRIIDFLSSTNYELRTTNNGKFTPLKISDFKGHERAFVKIQDGCSNFCSYCKVPLVRGVSRSRPQKEIIAECKRLVKRGFKEIVLTGICLGAYRYRDIELAQALEALENIKGEFRLRLSSIEPNLISNKLIEIMANSKRICPHLHIPLQSGDNNILKKMNRRYSIKDYLSLITKLNKKIKNIAITTDVLVGFPQEKEKNFRNTMRALKEICPLRTHVFSFSPRAKTAAFNLEGHIEKEVVKARADLLKKVASACSYKFRKRFLGKRLEVLIESQRDKKSSSFCGYSENYIRIIVENADKKDINSLREVKVKTVDTNFTKACI
ncbi:MAG: tRNA (N(6)-L-threonylcarbamoyladenosine(37)-C(2))-methylthiotransferase MtaB [Candidatus Omnitrophota bacterium]|nr:MAG: tRNA (N(6)-L-threonylcarbamoyladenosine(37)-C(2))-methylthiotransferase MtaB [Candidatus Omnitrophota bacterium]